MNKVTIETLAARVAALEAANDMKLEASIWRKEMEGRLVKPQTVEAPAGVDNCFGVKVDGGVLPLSAETPEAPSVLGDPAQLYDITIDGETYSLTTESEPIHYQGKTYFAFRKDQRSNPTGSL